MDPHFNIINALLTLEEEYCVVPDDKVEHYRMLTSYIGLQLRALEAGWEEFDWIKAVQNGWLSKKDFEYFKSDLNGMTYKEGQEIYLKERDRIENLRKKHM